MKALDLLRVQLIKDYPGDTPVFGKAPASPEETKFFFENTVLPAFEKIKKEFDSFHFTLSIRKFAHVLKLEIRDGCSLFSLSVKTSARDSSVTLLVKYRDFSIYSHNSEPRRLFEEKYDLSRISQVLPEELIITVFTEIFTNRRDFLRKIVEAELNEENEKTALIREERRARLIELKNNNDEFDPKDEFQKYLDSPEHLDMMRWLDMKYGSEDLF